MKILCLALLLAGSLPAAERTTPKRVWIRRATLAASCAASLVFDTMSTRRVVSAGGVESNPLFADASGRPQWGRVIGFKAGMCGVSTIMQETHVFHAWEGPRSDWT